MGDRTITRPFVASGCDGSKSFPHNKRHDDAWLEYDARGIPLRYVCQKCRAAKLATYRPDVLSNSNYWSDEPIEEDDSYGYPGDDY